MRPFHRTLRTLWTAGGILVGLAVVLWGAAFLGFALLPDDDGLGTAFLGIYLILAGMVLLGASLVVLLLRRARESRDQDPAADRKPHTRGA